MAAPLDPLDPIAAREERLAFDRGLGREGYADRVRARPLLGRAILVTRPEGAVDATATEIAARGGFAVSMPTVVLAPPDDRGPLLAAARALDRYHAVAFTSANAVAAFFEALDEVGKDARACSGRLVAAVGPATAEALRSRGVAADVVARVHRGEGLAGDLLAALSARAPDLREVRVLLPRAAVARDALPDALRAAGVTVDIVVAYVARPPAPAAVEALRHALHARAVDAVLFASSSSVDNLCDLLGAHADAQLAGLTVASIGPLTSATCRQRGLRVDVEAEPSTLPALLDALEAHERRAIAG